MNCYRHALGRAENYNDVKMWSRFDHFLLFSRYLHVIVIFWFIWGALRIRQMSESDGAYLALIVECKERTGDFVEDWEKVLPHEINIVSFLDIAVMLDVSLTKTARLHYKQVACASRNLSFSLSNSLRANNIFTLIHTPLEHSKEWVWWEIHKDTRNISHIKVYAFLEAILNFLLAEY